MDSGKTIIISIAMVVALFVFIIWIDAKDTWEFEERCQEAGGIFLEEYSKDYCLKPNSILFVGD